MLGREPVYLVNENPEHLIEWSIKVLTEKQEAIVRCFEVTPISFRFSDAFSLGEKAVEALG